jgi:hypothetical protein
MRGGHCGNGEAFEEYDGIKGVDGHARVDNRVMTLP